MAATIGTVRGSGLTYRQVPDAYNVIQTIGGDPYWLCVTRTVQESRLFPVLAYMLLSYLGCCYRYPTLLRKSEAVMPVEEFGDPTLSLPELSQLERLMRVATAPVVRYKAEGLEVSLQR